VVNAFQASQAIHVFTVLGLPGLLGDGRRSAADLAQATGTDPPSLRRLLRVLSALSILDEDDSSGFALTALGEGLREDVAGSVAGWAAFIGEDNFWQNWGQLVESVRTGQTGWRNRLNTDPWTYRAEHPELGSLFDRAMVSITGPAAAAVVDAYDFSRFRTIVDVGGGLGTMLAMILQRNPGIEGVLFDQPQVVASAPDSLRAQGVLERCKVAGGDFFDAVPTGADAYLLKSVIHDWYDDDARRILATVRRAAGAESRLLLVERVLPGPNQGLVDKLSDLNMLVNPGGMERTESEYRELLGRAGFRLEQTIPTAGPHHVLEAAPVASAGR
jgi:hypothetical protein